MNPTDKKYTQFALCREMMEIADVVRNFDTTRTTEVALAAQAVGRLMLAGEGSSRIFPAKNARRKALAWGMNLQITTDGSRQAQTYDLSKFVTFAASNSGRTREVISLMTKLESLGLPHRYGLTANAGTVLEQHATKTFVLTCGWEQAVAATKSVAEQALFYQSLVSHAAGRDMKKDLAGLDKKVTAALTMPIPADIVRSAAGARIIYFAGPNDGVAEELTLKTNEITRKPSDFLEGTYAVHGIEEVMDKSDVVFVVDPLEDDIPKFQEVLADPKKGVGLKVVAIATRPTALPTLVVPEAGEMNPYVFLAAGWNLLVEIGLALKVNLDKAVRARKVGNEVTG
jgi:glucosamine--fructose-6-phosphate aminotransferase (isomerizing)